MEHDLIAWLQRTLPPHPQLRLGVGDDAAVLRIAEQADAVVTTDLLGEGVHFRLTDAAPRQIGHKALAVNLSDLAAMAAQPVAAVIALLLPRTSAGPLARELIEGMLPLAARHHVALAGGDTNTWNGPLVVGVTAIGQTRPHGLWRRDGARPGDRILVTGSLGGSRLGHHLDFEPRVAEALQLAEHYQIHAAIDLSDGLATDLRHVVQASGCGAEVLLQRIPISEAARRLAGPNDPSAALRHALCDGEDFELLLAVAPEVANRIVRQQPLGVPVTDIGCFLDGPPKIWKIDQQGRRTELTESGYQHQANP